MKCVCNQDFPSLILALLLGSSMPGSEDCKAAMKNPNGIPVVRVEMSRPSNRNLAGVITRYTLRGQVI